MGEWRRVTLSEVADEVTVGHVGSMASEYRKSGIPFLRSQNVLPHRIHDEDIKFIDKHFHERLKKSALQPGDVVTVRTGKPGTSAVIPDWLGKANCSDLVITRPGPQLDARWLSYYLNFVTDADIAQNLVGAVQQHFNVGSAKALVLHLPEFAEQGAIADVLGALDDKIASNERHVRAIERLMLTLVENVSILVSLSDLAVQSTATRKPADFADLVAHFSLPAYDDGVRPKIAPASSIKSNKFVLSRPCVLFSKLNPRIPRIWNVPAVSQRMALASTEFVVLEPKGIDSSLLWAAASQPDVSVALQQKVAGTSGSHQRIKPAELLDVLVPDVRGLSAVESAAVGRLGALCEQCRTETQSLTRTRDELLPLLMSGKIRVKDAEAVVEDVL